jgi:DNA-binding IclR family transcriptional regulator
MGDDEALALVAAQGLRRKAEADTGPNAPESTNTLVQEIARARAQGYATAVDSYMAGMAAMAVPVRSRNGGPVLGCLSIAGPAVRMTEARMAELAPALQAAAQELGISAAGTRYFQTILRELDARDGKPG